MMSKTVRVEIKIVDGDWQWLGTLTEEQLDLLCTVADKLNDMTIEAPAKMKS